MHYINTHNYEAFLLDFSEGNLSEQLQIELEIFLIQHPELEINLSELSFINVENEMIVFSNKNSLKKTELDLVSQTQFIAYIEKQLPENECLELEKSCKNNPNLSKELKLYTSTINIPDGSVLFKNKPSLKRQPKVIWYNFSILQYAAAACVAFLIGFFALWTKSHVNSESSSLANKTNIILNNDTFYTNDIVDSREHQIFNKQKLSQNCSSKQGQLPVANNYPFEINKDSSINESIQDTIHILPNIQLNNDEALITVNTSQKIKPKTELLVITENDDENISQNSTKRQKGIWAAASKTLKKLNLIGVKNVNGNEANTNEKTEYALTLGGLNITHQSNGL